MYNNINIGSLVSTITKRNNFYHCSKEFGFIRISHIHQTKKSNRAFVTQIIDSKSNYSLTKHYNHLINTNTKFNKIKTKKY